jgi:hypothetical protein
VPMAHAAKFFELLGGAQRDGGSDGSGISKARLALLSGLTHFRDAIFQKQLTRFHQDRVGSERAILGDLKIIKYLPGGVMQE